jgi:hypothetical protein
MQKILSTEQIEAFYHDQFVEDQANHFVKFLGTDNSVKNVTDMGGGCGFFARRLKHLADYKVKVVDMDEGSVTACHNAGVEAVRGDALNPSFVGNEDVVTFNLILHHLVGASERATLDLQTKALAVWRPHIQFAFVNEYIYESYIGNFSGWLIFTITKSRLLSRFGQIVAKVLPSLKANTFGIGVRFRAAKEWQRVFNLAGYDVKSTIAGENELVSLPRRLLLIKNIRRDSFLLLPKLV